jgi:hypothetical protein
MAEQTKENEYTAQIVAEKVKTREKFIEFFRNIFTNWKKMICISCYKYIDEGCPCSFAECECGKDISYGSTCLDCLYRNVADLLNARQNDPEQKDHWLRTSLFFISKGKFMNVFNHGVFDPGYMGENVVFLG